VRLREELQQLNMVLARKNRELDALHYVWCSGGCDGGVNRFMPGQLTEDVVIAAERNTVRLRGWFENHKLREKYKAERNSHHAEPIRSGGSATSPEGNPS
jgi:hypothetical protein